MHPDRLATVLPDGFAPERFDIDGVEQSLVSTVSFTNRSFRFRAAPFVHMTAGQIDHRTYVRRDGEPGVWFLGMSLDHHLAAMGGVLFSMPWHREPIEVTASWSDDRCTSMAVAATGSWGETAIELAASDGATLPEALRSPLVTDQLRCWYPRKDGGIGRYTVWHEPIALQPMSIVHGWSRPFEEMGLLERGQAPLGAQVARSSQFDIHTPPTRVRRGRR